MEYAQGGYANANKVIGRGMEVPADAQPDASKVRDAITAAEQFQSEIHEHITLLEKRVDTVLRPGPPQQAGAVGGNTPQPICSHVTGRLNLLNEGLHGIVLRLRELRERVEV